MRSGGVTNLVLSKVYDVLEGSVEYEIKNRWMSTES